MAKCKAHGAEIGTVYYVTRAKRYMSDGTILHHRGQGWKLFGKVKAGIDPAAAYQSAKTRAEEYWSSHPLTADYRSKLHALCGQGKRAQLHMTVTLMPDDPDGVWSEACDDWRRLVDADLDDIVALCRAYQLAAQERARDSANAEGVAQ